MKHADFRYSPQFAASYKFPSQNTDNLYIIVISSMTLMRSDFIKGLDIKGDLRTHLLM